jgi:cation diffusion facilitator family transporter
MANIDLNALNREKILWARLSIVSNTFLMVLKVIVGFLTLSISIISEALHSGMDLIASCMAAYSVQKSAKPADETHRFGHGKYENISGLFEALLIGVVAVIIIYEAGLKLFEGPTLMLIDLGIVVMLVSVVVNVLVSRKLYQVARKTDSIALEADAAHLATDVWTSLGVFIAFVVIRVGMAFNFTDIIYLDPIIAVAVAVLIIWVAYKLSKRSFRELTDVSIPKEDESKIRGIIEEHYGQFVEFHEMRSRKSGSEIHLDLHLVVSKHAKVQAAHDLCEHLEEDIKNEFPRAHVLIHIEPCDENCEACKKIKEECELMRE